MLIYLNCFIGLFLLLGCTKAKVSQKSKNFTSKTLTIQKISDHVYQHISFLDAGNFGNVPCNGMIVFNAMEAVIFDTPTDSITSRQLINWVRDSLGCKITAIIPTHFHVDCLAGLEEFHSQGIPSYANNLTITLAKENHKPIPQTGFEKKLELKVGNKKVITEFFGEGHTKDNVVGYFPEEKIMFGGCLIKESGAGKGNLEDANTEAWSGTVTRLKKRYPHPRIVVPGHGKTGGTDLLDYTIQLFKEQQ